MGWFDDILNSLKSFATGGRFGPAGNGSDTGSSDDIARLLNPQAQKPNNYGPYGGLVEQPPGTNPAPSREDYLTQLYNQLLAGLKGTVPSMPSTDELMAQASQYASAQYDPQIKAIQQEMAGTKKRANTSSKELKELYKELSAQYKNDAGATSQDYKALIGQQKADAAELQKLLKDQYSGNIQEQAKELAGLGLDQATKETTRDQQSDLDYLKSLAGVQNNASLNQLQQGQAAGQDYYRQGALGALNEGSSAIEDLMANLEKYTEGRQGQITNLQGQKQSAQQMVFQQLQSQAAQSIAQAQQEQWNRLLQLGKFKQSMEGKTYKGISGASQLLDQTVGAEKAKVLMGRLNEVLQYAGTQKDKSMTAVLKYASDHAKNLRLNPQDTIALINALYAYYGKY